MDLGEVGCEDGRWICHFQWQDLVSAVLNLRFMLQKSFSNKNYIESEKIHGHLTEIHVGSHPNALSKLALIALIEEHTSLETKFHVPHVEIQVLLQTVRNTLYSPSTSTDYKMRRHDLM